MLKKFSLAVGSCVLFFLILEGLCSSLFVAYEILSPRERRTMSGPSIQYDRELGWVSVPSFYEKNYYAPNTSLQTNSKGFRAGQEFTKDVPTGKLRVICSGDSFTFGEGVGNDHTWCQDLQSLDERFQVVNLGQSGYGVDQMYLRYNRDGAEFNHDIHVFAFITEDFRRMLLTSYVGHGKPVLRLQDERLVTENVPVPKPSRFAQWFGTKRIQLRELRSVKLLGSLLGQLIPATDDFSKGPTEEQAKILDGMFASLQVMEKQKNSVLVLVCLPTTLHDFEQGGPTPAWRAWLRQESTKTGMVFVDLIDDFQRLPVTVRDGLFIWPGSVQYFAEAPGHYDDQGHMWIAQELYGRLISIPGVAEKLDLHSDSHGAKNRHGAKNGARPSAQNASAHVPSQ